MYAFTCTHTFIYTGIRQFWAVGIAYTGITVYEYIHPYVYTYIFLYAFTYTHTFIYTHTFTYKGILQS
jgi:hypothetical protein